ncbi:uncharacterized protein [Dysidea avara]|uniref:uncharacterized protein n=1 Tax=Dysidea avara TaxID=196820 RepID=UPI00332BB260
MAPRAGDVCRRFCRSPLPFLSVVAMILEIVAILAILIIGNYYAYSSTEPTELCYSPDYPSLRRTCVADIMGGMMAVIVAILLLMFECVSAFINQRDWKIVFIFVKLFLIFITVIILVGGAVYGALTYAEYCYDTELCQFSHRRHSDNGSAYIQSLIDESVDFSAVIITSGICAVWWILILFVEIIRSCIMQGRRADLFLNSELQHLTTTPDYYDD